MEKEGNLIENGIYKVRETSISLREKIGKGNKSDMKIEEKIEQERNKLNRMIDEGAPQEDVLEQSEVVDGHIVEYMKGA